MSASRPRLPASRFQQRFRGGRWALLLGGGALLLILLGVGMALHGGVYSARGTAVPAATATIDPRLVIYARTAPITGVLTGGVLVRGTLYPAYPGRNTLHVVLRRRGGVLAPRAPVVLLVTMPGMAMAPIHAQLTGRDSRYTGAITLPMFGAYRAQVSVATSGGHATGTMTLALSLPHL